MTLRTTDFWFVHRPLIAQDRLQQQRPDIVDLKTYKSIERQRYFMIYVDNDYRSLPVKTNEHTMSIIVNSPYLGLPSL